MGRIIRSNTEDITTEPTANLGEIGSQIGDIGSELADLATSYWRSYQEQPTITVPYASPSQEVQHRIDEANNMSGEAVENYMPESEKEESKSDDEYREEIFRRLDPSVEALTSSDWAATKALLSGPVDRRPVEETDADYTELKAFVNNPADYLFAEGGLLDPDNMPIIGSTDREKRARQEKLAYRQENPTPDNAFNGNLISDEYRQKYEDYFNSQGGLKDTSKDYASIVSDVFSQMEEAGGDPEQYTYMSQLRDALIPRLASYDNGELAEENVKSKYMSGKQYKEYANAGFGGRPIDQIEDDATYNKLDEMKDYGFVPYLVDKEQRGDWDLRQVADSVSKAYNMFGDLRERTTDAKINYNGQKLSRQDFYNGYKDYSANIEPTAKQLGDPSIDYESDLPVKSVVAITLDDGTSVQKPNPTTAQMLPNGGVYIAWDTGEDAEFDSLDEYYEYVKPSYTLASPEEADMYLSAPPLIYEQFDGTPVELSYREVNELADSMRNGTADMDWGWGNIAKDQSDRTSIGDMFTTGDFSDIVPNFLDLLTGSAPLFWGKTAWPMAIANGVTATQGLDPRQYDPETGTYRMISEDIDTDKYLSNVILSSLVPATERLAGGIGGKESPLWKPMQEFLKRKGVPAPLRYLVDWSGEGLEENVASAWEETQGNGAKYAFGNPVLDENGNPMYDESGHAIKEAWTPAVDRAFNALEGQDDNFFGGLMLGTAMGLPSASSNFKNKAGYFADDAIRRMQRKEEKENDLPKFRQAKRGNESVVITPDDIGTWGMSYEDYMNR